MKKKKELRNNPFFKSKTKDWEMVEQVIVEYESKNSETKKAKSNSSKFRAKD